MPFADLVIESANIRSVNATISFRSKGLRPWPGSGLESVTMTSNCHSESVDSPRQRCLACKRLG